MDGLLWLILPATAIICLVAVPRGAALSVQFSAIGLAVFVLLTFDGCVGERQYDPGGNPLLALAKVADARLRGDEVAIRGTCNSSCALKLAASNLCVSPRSAIGVHEVHLSSRPLDYRGGIRDDLWTGFFEGMLPVCARDLFTARGGFQGSRLAVVSGDEILRACPTIRACAAE